ncbi:MAG TPA: HAD hydrolase family protein [Allosphingosinicella sp.]|jgi:hypothetical protein
MSDPPPRVRGLFVMDLDGTLIEGPGPLCQENQEALRRAAQAGIAIAIVTGRRRSTFRTERDRLDGLSFRSSVSNGAVLLRPDNEGVEAVHQIAWEDVLKLMSLLPAGTGARCVAVTLPPEDRMHEAETPDALIVTAEGRFFHAPDSIEPELQESLEENAIDRRMALSRRLVHAAVHVPEAESVAQVCALVRATFGDAVSMHVAKPPRAPGAMVEILPRGGKGLAVRNLAASFEVAEEAIGAIGDGANDVTLLEAARHRYAIRGSVLAEVFPSAIRVGPQAGVAEALMLFQKALG